jgi:hypothetical protein
MPCKPRHICLLKDFRRKPFSPGPVIAIWKSLNAATPTFTPGALAVIRVVHLLTKVVL